MSGFVVEKTGGGSGADGQYQVKQPTPVEPWGAGAELRYVGQRHTRVEGVEKVTGSARFAYDVQLPGQLVGRVVRSPHPHARVTRIDATKAEALPGVHAVVSSANTREIPWYADSFVFDPTVRFIGEEVAAIAAETEEIAGDALRLIEVEYELLPFVTDLETALAPDAPKVRESGNIADEPTIYERGDVESGFREAEVTVDQIYTTQCALHNSFEPHGCTASWEGDNLTLWDSTQSIFTVRDQVAKALDMPSHRVRVIKQFMGGGFGAKQIAWKQDVIASLLSKASGRPVQLMLDREAENLAVGNRNPTHQRVRLGSKRDGTLTAISVEIHQQAGAHMTGGEASDVSAMYQTLYRCPNVRTDQTIVYTNTGPAVAFRAPGHVESAAALECAMDELARALEMDPSELRLRNYSERDQQKDQPYTSPESLSRCSEQATRAFGWQDYRKPEPDGPKRRGIGFAAHDWGGGGQPPGYAWVKLNPDGTADVVTGTQDIGTGTRTGLAQVAAEELGMPIEDVRLHLGDTAYGPYAPVSSGSATQATIGPAIRAAAFDAKRQLFAAAAVYLETQPVALSIHDGKLFVAGRSGQDGVPVGDVMSAIAPVMVLGQGAREPNPEGKTIRTVGAQCIEVEVDIETGDVQVLRVVASHDCGRIVNPTMVDSQIIGAVTQGIGFALTEERVVDPRLGIVLNANLEEYKVPTVADIPLIEHAAVDVPDVEANSTGAKGIGEPPLVPTAPAIANAVFDAIGIRFREFPLSRRRVLDALAGGEAR
ncbi:MAG TPA: xanthine dehydrogenase family protein molybdopterin-binding subunit [Thermomicrobiales bacterium]|jgi:xanthine dehydrogenase YagR molybdenum-binding subunit|nr:xanthine dehydrogenase family protein molybdopterin-binding subunit [Thermomicrobiales bacterium]